MLSYWIFIFDNKMNNQELDVSNYHKESEKIEASFFAELILLLSPLVMTLSSIYPLTKQRIDAEVLSWKIANNDAVKNINKEHIDKALAVVDKIFKKKVATDSIIYVDANEDLINNILGDLAIKFKELAIIDQAYPMSKEARDDYLDSIQRSLDDKIELFSTMSTISTIRAMMFDNATEEGYTEYQWHTQRDRRVRPTHAYMDGRWVNFNDPPKETGGYHVAQDWGCRCFASKFR